MHLSVLNGKRRGEVSGLKLIFELELFWKGGRDNFPLNNGQICSYEYFWIVIFGLYRSLLK